jgi:hypothetical protein
MSANECYLPPGAGNLLDLGGLGVHFKIRGDQTGGAFAIVEHPMEPHVIVEPHVHSDEDVLSYVVAGTIWAGLVSVSSKPCKALRPRQRCCFGRSEASCSFCPGSPFSDTSRKANRPDSRARKRRKPNL